jgi:hypothetical protein
MNFYENNAVIREGVKTHGDWGAEVEKVWEPGNLVPRKYCNLTDRKFRFELVS